MKPLQLIAVPNKAPKVLKTFITEYVIEGGIVINTIEAYDREEAERIALQSDPPETVIGEATFT